MSQKREKEDQGGRMGVQPLLPHMCPLSYDHDASHLPGTGQAITMTEVKKASEQGHEKGHSFTLSCRDTQP